ncbi:hypothetical protein ACFFNY_14610 [Paenibacillus hodogayensis]|uniref:Uncharacterized protein n=1 Tax=Paenibacillus hodogayensis TaxID=279208 RepID=A0ABV5VXB5_9BACL
MPYVLKHAESAELFACTLVNRYDLPYFGVKDWEDEEAAVREKAGFLEARGVGESSSWEVVPVTEMQLKLANVKLKNDPGRRVFLDEDGTLRLEKRG